MSNQDRSLTESCFPMDSFPPFSWADDTNLHIAYYQQYPDLSGQYLYNDPHDSFGEYGYPSSTSSGSESGYDYEGAKMSEDNFVEPFAHPREWAELKAAIMPHIDVQFRPSDSAVCDPVDTLSVDSTTECNPTLSIRVPDLVNSTSSSEYGDSDDSFSDYRPSPSPEPVFRKASRSRPYRRQQNSQSSSPEPTSMPSRRNRRGSRRNARSPASRNIQAAGEEAALLEQRLESNRNVRSALVCPHPGCRYHQANGRLPDFRRHMRTHLRKTDQHRCKGVAYSDFLQFPDRFREVPEDALPYTVDGCAGMWIGGCQKTFSRSDALKRHYDKQTCVRHA